MPSVGTDGGKGALIRRARAAVRLRMLAVIVAVALVGGWPKPASSACSFCLCVVMQHEVTTAYLEAVYTWLIEVVFNVDFPAGVCALPPPDSGIPDPDDPSPQISPFGGQEYSDHKNCFIVENFFKRHVEAAMERMTQQLEQSGLMMMEQIGAFLDAKHQLETQRLFQRLTAKAHKNYHATAGMCTMGTAAEGMDAAYANGDLVAAVLARRSEFRQLHHTAVAAAAGGDTDVASRLKNLKERLCDIHDNNYTSLYQNEGLQPLCGSSGDSDRVNRDVDYGRAVSRAMTIDIDFMNGTPSEGSQDVLALANNLYANDILDVLPEKSLQAEGNQSYMLDFRSIVAKRAVAEHSFNAIVGMKAEGSPGSADKAEYMYAALEQLGMTRDEAKAMLGERPSYHAQMEMLTKKLYQNPQFYIDLEDSPANVARKGAAIRAISLIQSMDMLKSQLRNEMALSVLLELEVTKYEDEIENARKNQRSEGASM